MYSVPAMFNAAEYFVDRHVREGRGALVAIECGDRQITYAGLHESVNRTGSEGLITFYGSSFISDPYGRKLVQAPRDEPAVLVAELDIDQRGDWLELFPFLTTRLPDAYRPLIGDAGDPPSASEGD